MKRKLTTLVALMLSCLLAILASSLEQAPAPSNNSMQITRVWTVETDPAVSAWLKKRAATYEKETGHRIYLRTATQEEMDACLQGEEGAIIPDLIVSCNQGEALAYLGYALILRDESAPAVTPAPTSALFFRPTATPGPSPTPGPALDINALGAILIPETLSVSLPGGIKSSSAAADFIAKKAPAALLTAGQASTLPFGYQAYALPFNEGFETISGQAFSQAGDDFAVFLQSLSSQQRLKEHGLYSAFPGLYLYDESDPLRKLIESALPH
ncbi:MAG: hypothetical protein E7329_09700 [Clostridiales bacterium]|nr:hypothetical protein [Clostridiales bacterium]